MVTRLDVLTKTQLIEVQRYIQYALSVYCKGHTLALLECNQFGQVRKRITKASPLRMARKINETGSYVYLFLLHYVRSQTQTNWAHSTR